MLNTTFVKFWQLSVSVAVRVYVYLAVFVWMCCTSVLDVLHFCSVDVTSNLSHQLLCFIMMSYCSYFIIVYNYISLISCLFILTFLLQEEEKKNSVFFDQYFTQNTYTLQCMPFQTTQNNTNINYTIQQWTDTMFCLSINTIATNLIDSMALLQRYFNTCLYNTMSAILKIFCLTKLWKYSVTWKITIRML